MSYMLVDADGSFLIGTSGDPDSVFTGTGLQDATLELQDSIARAMGHGDAYPQKDSWLSEYRGRATVLLQSTDTTAFFGVLSAFYGTHKTQGATTLFAGDCARAGVTDRQGQRGSYEQMTIGWESTGEPDVG